MVKKPKLSKELNQELIGLTLQQKLDILHKWKLKRKISDEIFNFYSRYWIEKDSKKLRSSQTLRKIPTENLVCRCHGLAAEGEVQSFLDYIRSISKEYFIKPSCSGVVITSNELKKFKKYVENYFVLLPDKVYRLLIEGLRFPDSSGEINAFCNKWITSCPRDYYQETHFWFLLWEEGSFVPMDAIRLMLEKTDGVYQINKRFDVALIAELLPKFIVHRNMEMIRLENAQRLTGAERDREVSRKIRRLEAFNLLISSAEKFCGKI